MADGVNKVGEPYTPPQPVEEEAPAEENVVPVQTGDSLDAIADRHGLQLQDVLAANPELKNPNLIHVGDNIKLPPGVTPQAAAPNPAAAGEAGVPNPALDAAMSAPDGAVDVAAVGMAIESGLQARGVDPLTADPQKVASALADMALPYAGHPQAAVVAASISTYRSQVIPAMQGVDDAYKLTVAAEEQNSIIQGDPTATPEQRSDAELVLVDARRALQGAVGQELDVRAGLPGQPTTPDDVAGLTGALDIFARYGNDGAIASAAGGALMQRYGIIPATPAADPSAAPPLSGDNNLGGILANYVPNPAEWARGVFQAPPGGATFDNPSANAGFFFKLFAVPPSNTGPFPSVLGSPEYQNAGTDLLRAGFPAIWGPGTVIARGKDVADALALQRTLTANRTGGPVPSGGLPSRILNHPLTGGLGSALGLAGPAVLQLIDDKEKIARGELPSMSVSEHAGRSVTAGTLTGLTGYLGGRGLATLVGNSLRDGISRQAVGATGNFLGRVVTRSAAGGEAGERIAQDRVAPWLVPVAGLAGGSTAGAYGLQIARDTQAVDFGGKALDAWLGAPQASLAGIQSLSPDQAATLLTQIDANIAGLVAAERLTGDLAGMVVSGGDASPEAAASLRELEATGTRITDARLAAEQLKAIVQNGGQGVTDAQLQQTLQRVSDGTQSAQEIAAVSGQVPAAVEDAVNNLSAAERGILTASEALQSDTVANLGQGALIGGGLSQPLGLTRPALAPAAPVAGATLPRVVGTTPPVTGTTLPRVVGTTPPVPGTTLPRVVGTTPPIPGTTLPRVVGTLPSPAPAPAVAPVPPASTASRVVGAVGTVARRAVLPVAAVTDVVRIAEAQDKPRAIASVAGGWAGAAVGATWGSAAGPVGTVVGGAIGYVVGSGLAEAAWDGAKNLWNSVFG